MRRLLAEFGPRSMGRRYQHVGSRKSGAADSLPEPASLYPRPVIDLSTIAGLLEHDHGLAAYCPRCDRWSVLPLAQLVAQGKGSLRLPLKVRCRDCGEVGELQVRPPMPARSSSGWTQPPHG